MIKKPKLLLLGNTGQLGSALKEYLKLSYNLIKPCNKEFMFISYTKLQKKLDEIKPEIIVYTLAFTQVDNAEKYKNKAFFLNAKLPEILSKWCFKKKCFLIHYSSDYVFSGKGFLPKKEINNAKPINFYGFTKLKGDISIKNSGANSIILRCSWIYSISHNSFLKTILVKMKNEKDLRVVNDQIGTPTSAKWIANITQELINKRSTFKNFNLIHCVPNGYVSWYEFCKLIFNIINQKDFELKTQNIIPISSKKILQKASRPKNSRLDNSKLCSLINHKLPKWQDLLIDELKKYK